MSGLTHCFSTWKLYFYFEKVFKIGAEAAIAVDVMLSIQRNCQFVFNWITVDLGKDLKYGPIKSHSKMHICYRMRLQFISMNWTTELRVGEIA